MKIAVQRSEVVEVEGRDMERGGSAAARDTRRERVSLSSGEGVVVVVVMTLSGIWARGKGGWDGYAGRYVLGDTEMRIDRREGFVV